MRISDWSSDVCSSDLRPDVMNAANAQLEIELCRFFTEVSHDANTRVVIVTGQGKAFSAGGDFAYIQEMMDQPARFLDTMPYSKRLIFSMLDCSKPVIAKINGHAMGLGATLALDRKSVGEGKRGYVSVDLGCGS